MREQDFPKMYTRLKPSDFKIGYMPMPPHNPIWISIGYLDYYLSHTSYQLLVIILACNTVPKLSNASLTNITT